MTNLSALLPISKADLKRAVALEMAKRAHPARQSLIAFTQHTYTAYRPEKMHELIGTTLDKVVAGEIKRLMIFAPPQHGKSELVSVRLPAYWLGKRPNSPVILTSYAASLAESKSRQARAIVESPEYRELFPAIKLQSDSRSVARWELQGYRGGLLATGVGGPVTGNGGLLGIIDDPFENWEQAQSTTIRNKTWEWYRTTFRTRIWEGGAIVLIMTRWHNDDLAGRILQDQGDQWEVLRLPALAETQGDRDKNNAYLGLRSQVGNADPLGREPDQPLAPKRYSAKELGALKRDVGSLAWAAEYQGVPRPLEGSRIKREWLPIVEAAPALGVLVRYWDKAGSEADGACWTAGVLTLVTKEGETYILDVVRGRWTAAKREAVIKQTAQLDAEKFGNVVRIYVEQEPGSGGMESAESTIRNLVGYRVEADRPSGNKDVRIEPFAAQAEAGNIHLLRGAWNGAYIEELCALPNSEYRDQADATAGAFNKACEVRSPKMLTSALVAGATRKA